MRIYGKPSFPRIVARLSGCKDSISSTMSGTAIDDAAALVPSASGVRLRPEGLEPPTIGSEDRGSIQLSYGRKCSCYKALQ